MIKVAQIGCGYWGPNLLRAFQNFPTCQIKYAVELAEDRRAFLGSQFPSVKTLASHETVLLDPEVTAVVIATPAHTHYKLVKEFLLAGKHVLVEKPLATRTDHARELAEIAETRQLVLMAGHTFLYNPAVHYLKEKMKTELGELYYLYAQRLNLGKLRTDVNVWWNLAPHDISILLFLMDGKVPDTIALHGTSFLQSGIEDIAFATLRWSSGLTAHIHVSWIDPGKVRKMTLVGSKKMIVYDDVSEEKITIYDKGIDITGNKAHAKAFDHPSSLSISHRSGDIYIPKINMQEPLKLEAAHFIDCILKKIPCVSGPKHAVDVVAILEAGQRSLHNNGCHESISYYEPAYSG